MRGVFRTSIAVALVLATSGAATRLGPPRDRGSAPDSAASPESAAPEGYEVQRAFLEDAHVPYGAGLPDSVLSDIWDQINRLGPPRRDAGLEPPWELIGPKAMLPRYYYGRVLDVEAVDPFSDVRVASASGGLWWLDPSDPGVLPRPISDDLESLVIGSFASRPVNRDDILVGTGEPGVLIETSPNFFGYAPMASGRGLFRTLDAGANWFEVPLPDKPLAFYRVRWDPVDLLRIHIAADNGYFLSTDGGLSWSRPLEGTITDLAFDPFPSGRMWAGRWHQTNAALDSLGGIWQSTDSGESWVQLATGGAPAGDVGRISLTVSSTDPASPWIYASVARHSQPDSLRGIYRSTNGGFSWTLLPNPDSPANMKQGSYNNAILADPDLPSDVLVGWVKLYRSTDAGMTWTTVNADGTPHDDQHLLRMSEDGVNYYLANDGGVYLSSNGQDWEVDSFYPITQFYSLDVDPLDPLRLVGGAQDNGFSYVEDPFGDGLFWRWRDGGDTGGVAIARGFVSPPEITWLDGPVSGTYAYRNKRSLDAGVTAVIDTVGMLGTTQWLRKVRANRAGTAPSALVSHSQGVVYRWNRVNEQWDPLNVFTLGGTIFDVTVVDSAGEVLWAVTTNDQIGQNRVQYRDAAGNWMERSAGLPEGPLRKVAGDRYGGHPELGYALMRGLGTPIKNARIFKTTDAGQHWVNVTGDLPDVPMFDLVENPTDSLTLYAATDMGAFRTTNGGANWLPWNEGWPKAVMIREFVPVFFPEQEQYWLYAATFGRSAWRRNLGDPRSSSIPLEDAGDIRIDLTPFPNPFRERVAFRLTVPRGGPVELSIHDVRGRRVRRLAVPEAGAGGHVVEWDGRDAEGAVVAPGVYFARAVTSDGTSESKITRIH